MLRWSARSAARPATSRSTCRPRPTSDQAVVDVLAVGLHPRVRSGASGSHYTSTGKLPMVPGVDGVGRREDGQLVYFVADDELAGPMATRTVIDTRRSVVLPEGADVVKIAAAMNPAMSAWVALRRRVPIEAGPVGPGPGRYRQRRPDGHPGRQASRRGPGGRRRPRPGPPRHPARDRRGRDRRADRRRRRDRRGTGRAPPARSTWSSTTCGASPPPTRSWRCCGPAPTAAGP